MLFSSLIFIFRFLPLFLITYFIVPAKLKNAVLLIGSLLFYAFGEPVYVLLMMLSIVVNYFLARVLYTKAEGVFVRRFMLIMAVLYNVGLLIAFKYTGFFISIFEDISGVKVAFSSPALPLGISFYTFQILSYVIDVYKNEIEAERNIIDLGAYLCLFPQLIAGPIVVYRDVREQLKKPKLRISMQGFDEGIKLFTIGLASKVLFANRFGQVWDSMAEMGYENLATGAAWIGAIAYTLQIYFDFNGYSLMAVGLGKMLGFDFPRNFNQPYTAVNITDFWGRWHMTLTSFFREYIYIPLGGNRAGRFKTYRNMFIVWMITGFWHGAGWNFILWGLYYFIFLLAERVLIGKKDGIFRKLAQTENRFLRIIFSIFGHCYALIIIVTGWVIFAVEDISEIGSYLIRMFAPLFGSSIDGYFVNNLGAVMFVWIAIGAVFSTPVFVGVYEKYKKNPIVAIVLLAVFWTCISQLVDGSYNPFLYFRF